MSRTPSLSRRAGAMISSVSSVGGRFGAATWSVYSATKFAVVGFHDALRKELGEDGIRVSVLEPGAVWSEFGENVSEAIHERRLQLDALQSADVAQALVFAFAQPANVLIQEILMRPVKQIIPPSRRSSPDRHSDSHSGSDSDSESAGGRGLCVGSYPSGSMSMPMGVWCAGSAPAGVAAYRFGHDHIK
jgi:NAD(P)-dependent dehydrogenase (short-subunit alcohol dehydrogenase family)